MVTRLEPKSVLEKRTYLLVDSPSVIFCPPRAGKPDPNASLDLDALKPRVRIKQPAQKGNTCWYYAACILYERVGKYPSESQLQKRNIEKLVSRRRKAISNLGAELDPQLDFSRQITSEWGRNNAFTKIDAQKFLSQVCYNSNWEHSNYCGSILNEFLIQNEQNDLVSYISFKIAKKSIEADEIFLRELGVSAERVHRMEQNFPANLEKQIKLNIISIFVGWLALGLKCSHWHPAQSIDHLIESLRLHGAHHITGKMGQMFYVEQPFKLVEKVAGQALYGWKPNAERSKAYYGSDFHVIVLVGADRNKNRVYFIDPWDGSDPEKENYAKVYVTSYERLQKNIANLFSMQLKDTAGNTLYATSLKEGENLYAMYGDPLKACL